jgi:hypothetical protein
MPMISAHVFISHSVQPWHLALLHTSEVLNVLCPLGNISFSLMWQLPYRCRVVVVGLIWRILSRDGSITAKSKYTEWKKLACFCVSCMVHSKGRVPTVGLLQRERTCESGDHIPQTQLPYVLTSFPFSSLMLQVSLLCHLASDFRKPPCYFRRLPSAPLLTQVPLP